MANHVLNTPNPIDVHPVPRDVHKPVHRQDAMTRRELSDFAPKNVERLSGLTLS